MKSSSRISVKFIIRFKEQEENHTGLDNLRIKEALQHCITEQFGKSGVGLLFDVTDYSADTSQGIILTNAESHRKVLACAALLTEIEAVPSCLRLVEAEMSSELESEGSEKVEAVDPSNAETRKTIAEFEEKFKDRYTDDDALFQMYMEQGQTKPPVVYPWEDARERPDRRDGDRGRKRQHSPSDSDQPQERGDAR
ncbi:hypothetical protein RvY_19213-1 [Ramazzottius varieornatus]|uniref:Uncharacterized protein n=1 Tax=Ramazzottius varieornatus TaxID=947166 RepID=A0A1D1W8M4_RAMVA|nr:hypothetical protein RvY_19213-1 [Ramazzottius varieornatus]